MAGPPSYRRARAERESPRELAVDGEPRAARAGLIRAPLRAKELANWNVLPGSQAVGRHMNLQDYWVAAPSVRENLPEGYVREAYDRWYAQLGELPPELEGRGIDPTEQFDYAEAALCLLR